MPDPTRLRVRALAIPIALLVTACFDPTAVVETTGTDGPSDSSGATPGTGPDGDVTGSDAGSDDAPPLDTGEPTSTGPGDDSTSGDPPCEPTSEICDGLDNDCDGEIDDEVTGTGSACDTGLEGVCAEGTTACEGGEIVCAPNVEPSAEVCDGLDNNCDGVPDDGKPAEGVPCRAEGVGVCNAGTTSCAGETLECVPNEVPSAEVCDGLDNDCNGVDDDGNPGGGMPCATGLLGACSGGLTVCEGGVLACMQTVFPTDEICDELDNDCDGLVDDGNPGGGASCVTGLPGVCSAGTVSCASGPAQCVPNTPAAPSETCGNGLDDDCNGSVDDNCGCSHGVCTTGAALINGCLPCVAQICAVDPFCCDSSWDSQCVGEVESICGQATCVSPSCAHGVCTTGGVLASGCHSCVTQICNEDPYCCNTAWDLTCVSEVGTICGLTCG